MTRNIVAGWVAQFVQIIGGFILPHLIDKHLTTRQLGVWDFAWTVVAYFSLLQGGLVSSVNRYVAKFHSKGDLAGLNQAVSSSTMLLRGVGLGILLVTGICVACVPHFMKDSLRDFTTEIQWMILVLGLSNAITVSASCYAGILTGCHRWDLNSSVLMAQNVVSLLISAGLLLLGYGLVALAVAQLIIEAAGRSARAVFAYRVCPGLSIRWRHFHWDQAKEMIGFGGKSLISQLSSLFLNQTVNMLITPYFGLTVLAHYNRPVKLIQNLTAFMQRYAMVFTPAISSMQAAGNTEAVIELTLNSVRYSAFVCLPLLLTLGISGAGVMTLWMGPDYADGLLVAAVVLAFAPTVVYMPLTQVLMGLNLHGRSSMANLVTSIIGVVGVWIDLRIFHGGLISLAAVLGVSMFLSSGIYLPIYTCRQLKVPFLHFLDSVWRMPVLCSLPYVASLLVARFFFPGSPIRSLLVGGSVGGVLLISCYWVWVVPTPMKQKLARKLGFSK